MLKNTISYAGENILTVYHKGFDEDVKNRHLKTKEKLGRFQLIFEEKVVPDEEVENISYNGWKMEGLLSQGAVLNPYRKGACAFVEQFISLDKPRRLFSNTEEYSLKVDVPTFQQICSFIEKYIGIDLLKAPLCFGNTFIYEYSPRNFHAYKEDGIVVSNKRHCDTIIVNFKKDDLVVCTKIIHTTNFPQEEDIIILSTSSWNNYDIELYADGKLIYFDKDTYFMRSLKINATIGRQGHTIPLKNLGKEFKTMNSGKEQIITNITSENKTFEELKIKHSESNIRRRLNEEEVDDSFLFIKPNEVQKAMDFIKKELEKPCKEIWFFDSYFSDRNGVNYSIDLIRIFAFCHAEEKHIIFHNNPKKTEHNPISAAEFATIAKQDSVIQSLKGTEPLKIQFYQTKQRIHDRFLFIIDKEGFITGITIGTSLNSLDSNYFCMYKLYKGTARHVFEELKKFTILPHIVEKSTI
ncbi:MULTISPECIES: hypothetical protein [Paenibacillus]|uniref:Uncharacterized protein n=1 Tax=Paenibacillus brasilensis TaxID=128574 RepID=A0ABU0L264_9BACL|nr:MULTISPECIES: hypothetical protein [Paenibacillus]MDQ0495771.1 hypothetical protein [Paenibacillus brasilensis]